MENLSAVSYASTDQRASVDVVRYAQSIWSKRFLLSLSQILVCGIFEGGDAKPWYFTALEHPPQKRSTVEVGFSENLQRPGVEVRRGHARFAFLIYVYPPDISWYIQEKVWHPEDPPHVFWKPKKYVGVVYSTWSGGMCPPPNIPGLKGGIVFVAFPIGTVTLVSRRSCTHIPPETRQMSQSATPAPQNDMSTSSDTSRKTRFCDFSHRHGNFSLTTVAHTPSGWNTSNVTKCHACHAKRHEHIFWHVEKDTFLWLFP